jgi:hypothetical protein
MPTGEPCVINLRHGAHRRAVAIDRQGPWGNPFRIGHDGDRYAVLRAHEDWLRAEVELVAELWRLKGRFLACWCDPLPCHGWLLFYLANCTEDELEDWLLGDRFWTNHMLAYRSVPGAPGCYVRLHGEL